MRGVITCSCSVMPCHAKVCHMVVPHRSGIFGRGQAPKWDSSGRVLKFKSPTRTGNAVGSSPKTRDDEVTSDDKV